MSTPISYYVKNVKQETISYRIACRWPIVIESPEDWSNKTTLKLMGPGSNNQSCVKYSTNKYQYQHQYQWSKYQYKYQYLTFKYQHTSTSTSGPSTSTSGPSTSTSTTT